jgi:hypothetical protein
MNRGKPRPPFLRALGKHDPPQSITVDGAEFERAEIFKHDSWAATALYQAGQQKIVCKFNRRRNLFGFPMRWLGYWLARRESAHYQRLQGIPGIAKLCGAIYVNGSRASNAVAHEFIAGNPLRENVPVNEEFDSQLRELIAEVHRRKIAYVDLHKRENIIVTADGRPHLIDFQVSWMAPLIDSIWSWPRRWLLGRLQTMDQYHLDMHEAHHRRLRGDFSFQPDRPWWIKWHRKVTVPIRQARRWALIKLGIRSGYGMASTEHSPEQAFR